MSFWDGQGNIDLGVFWHQLVGRPRLEKVGRGGNDTVLGFPATATVGTARLLQRAVMPLELRREE